MQHGIAAVFIPAVAALACLKGIVAFAHQLAAREFQADASSPAFGHVDLLTVVTHELGHVLGFASVNPMLQAHDWMTETLATGIRRFADPAAAAPPLLRRRPRPRGQRGNSPLPRPAYPMTTTISSPAATTMKPSLALAPVSSPRRNIWIRQTPTAASI
jgi:hypothetical protein